MDNNSNYEDVCMMCHRTESKAGRMVKLPGNLCVCEDCMNRSYDLIKNMGLVKMFESIQGAFQRRDVLEKLTAQNKRSLSILEHESDEIRQAWNKGSDT